ncbi:MAG: DUF4148 domain-containing protein [Aquincola tertiaricarbonis]|uniref:DUF4148 domain-containing protein n=1 Tax=Aquincola tertiaricarbonis TaxID=391953 RepID=UPI00061532CF|nr:DUF4148 domain-containing protein [Aquincola tertiaricarbonis]
MKQVLRSIVPAVLAGLLCTASALAQQAAADAGPTRAQVQAEMRAAEASGETRALTGEDSGSAWLQARPAPAALSRAEVRRQVLEARRSGELGALSTEDSGSFYLARQGGAMPRPATGLAAAPR